jgi:transposase-like protein
MSPVSSLKNKYAKRSKISEAKFRKLVQHFASDIDAKTIAGLSNLNRNTVNRYLALIRERIAEFCHQESPLKGDGNNFESYLSGNFINGEHDSFTDINTPVFGVFHCRGKICTVAFPSHNLHSDSRQDHFLNKASEDEQYQLSYLNRYRISNNEHLIYNVESFLSYARQRLMKFHGIPEATFYLHLKECEFRFNYRNDNLYPILLKILRENPLC